MGEHQSMTIGRRAANVLHRDDAAGTGAVINLYCLAPHGRKLFGDQSGRNIGCTAGWRRHHDANGFARPGLSVDDTS